MRKNRPGQLQAHPHQAGAVDQHGAERGNGLVQQALPVRFGHAGPLRGPDRRQADQEEDVRVDLVPPGQRAQDAQRFRESALPDQGAGLREAGRAGRLRRG